MVELKNTLKLKLDILINRCSFKHDIVHCTLKAFQPTNQPMNQTTNQTISQSINTRTFIYKLTKQSIDQSINEPINPLFFTLQVRLGTDVCQWRRRGSGFCPSLSDLLQRNLPICVRDKSKYFTIFDIDSSMTYQIIAWCHPNWLGLFSAFTKFSFPELSSRLLWRTPKSGRGDTGSRPERARGSSWCKGPVDPLVYKGPTERASGSCM